MFIYLARDEADRECQQFGNDSHVTLRDRIRSACPQREHLDSGQGSMLLDFT